MTAGPAPSHNNGAYSPTAEKRTNEMALVYTIDAGFPVRVGKWRMTVGTVAFDNSYPTGGEAMVYSSFKFHRVLNDVQFVGGQKGYNIEFAGTTAKVMSPAVNERILNPDQAARSLIGAAGDVTVFHVSRPTYVVGFSSVVTTTLHTSTGAPVMSVAKRNPDGAGGAVELATITYTDHDAVGALDSYFTGIGAVGGGATTASALVTPYLIPAGYTIALIHKTQGTNGGGDAGEAKCHIAVSDVGANIELPNTYDLSALTAVRFMAFGY